MDSRDNMSFVMARHLERMADKDADPVKDAAKAIVNLYNYVKELSGEIDRLKSRVEELELR